MKLKKFVKMIKINCLKNFLRGWFFLLDLYPLFLERILSLYFFFSTDTFGRVGPGGSRDQL